MEFGRYTPEFLNRYFAADATPPTEPGGEQFTAAAMWCDISGFTPLTERLVAAGPEGVEELTTYLNRYYGKLIDLVQAHGGDVIQFEGDAMLAVWRAGEHASLADLTYRAAQASLQIQKELDGVRVGGDIALSQRVAIGVGTIRLFWVGGVLSRWTIVAAGEPLTQVQSIDHDCEPGQVVLSQRAWGLIAERCTGQVLGRSTLLNSTVMPLSPEPLRHVEVDEAAEDALRLFIAGAVLSRMKAGHSKWLAELRTISALFVQMPDLDGLSEDIVEQVQAITEQIQHAIYRVGGSMNKMSLADKGATVLCGFGVPPLSHEDDPLRAVNAAIDIVERLGKLGVRAGVGVTTGQCFCGLLGSDQRAEYTTLGRTVNLASRLMQIADEDVIVDEETFKASEQRLVYETLAPRKVKGFAQAVPMFRATGERLAAPRAQTEIIGRLSELGAISNCQQAVLREQRSSLLVLEGEAGIGKSRILTEAIRRADDLDVRVVLCEAMGIERDTPYYAWRSAVRDLLGVEEHAQKEALREAVTAALAEKPKFQPLAPLLNALLPLDLEETAQTLEMHGEVRANNTRLLVQELVREAAEAGPLMLVVEDAHWMDSASWGMVSAIGREVDPLFLLLATRPLAQPPQEYSALVEREGTESVVLDRLSIDETVQIVCQRLEVVNLPDEVVELLLEKADGNPFFSEELAYALRDSGHLLIDAGTAGLAPGVDLSELTLPTTVQGAVVSRVDRLEPGEQLLLKVASVIGREFLVEILGDIYSSAEGSGAVGEMLPGLVELKLLLPDDDALQAYIFKHALSQQAIYQLMLFAQRRLLHRSVAEWYEASKEELAPVFPLLAHHWTQADESNKAAEYNYRAGMQALKRFANREAVRFLSRSIELCKADSKLADAGRMAEMEEGLCEAYWAMGDLGTAKGHAHNALALLGQPVPGSTPGRVLGLWVQIAKRVWQARFAKEPKPTPEESLKWRASARMGNRLAELAGYSDDNVGAIFHAMRQLNAAHNAGPTPELGRAYSVVSTMIGTIPLPKVADVWVQRALETAATFESQLHRAWVYSRCAVYDIYRARWHRANELIGDAIEMTERLNDRRVREEALVISALALMYMGEFLKAEPRFARLIELARGSGNGQALAWGSLGRAECLLRFGRAEEALEHCQEVRVWVNEKGLAADRAWGLSISALAKMRMGRVAEAVVEAEPVLVDYVPQRPVAYWGKPVAPALAEIYAAAIEQKAGDVGELRKKLKKTVKSAQTFGKIFPFGDAAAIYLQGLEASVTGDKDKAIAHWQRCVTQAEEQGTRLELGLAHLRLSQHLPEGNASRAQANTVLGEIGASADVP